MTVTVQKALNSTTEYPDYGMSTENEPKVHEVSYTARGLEDFDGHLATAVFSVKIGDVAISEPYRLRFTYSGEGNPLDQAEPALEAFLAKQEAAAKAAAEQEEGTAETPSESSSEVLSNS
ncbi:hypothetical protein PEp14_00017 [Erwinia phage PEp14]|uniref:Uncharacterized protein n=1 Tax=Erwinia phage PEp14 TaxID=1131315 RepID=H2DE47_9CAUD|nr:hypothetical protein PEp14_00017 [Erwinia phage PEp14]AEY69606.1 hypothetical protein PEp14_00017 [Erwinia phage PEp14]